MNANWFFWCKWHISDPRCMYGKLPHIDVGCKCSLPLDSKCQLRKFKYVCRSWKGTWFRSFKVNAIHMFHGIAIVDYVQWELLAYYKLCTPTHTHNTIFYDFIRLGISSQDSIFSVLLWEVLKCQYMLWLIGVQRSNTQGGGRGEMCKHEY